MGAKVFCVSQLEQRLPFSCGTSKGRSEAKLSGDLQTPKHALPPGKRKEFTGLEDECGGLLLCDTEPQDCTWAVSSRWLLLAGRDRPSEGHTEQGWASGLVIQAYSWSVLCLRSTRGNATRKCSHSGEELSTTLPTRLFFPSSLLYFCFRFP